MSKLKLMFVVAGGVVLIAGSGLLFFANKSHDLSRQVKNLSAKLGEISPNYQKLSQEESNLKGKNSDLLKENEAIKIDRENLLAQIKALLQERSRANNLAVSLEKANNDAAGMVKERQLLLNYNLKQTNEITKLQGAQKDLTNKLAALKTACGKSATSIKIKDLKRKAADLKKENISLGNSIKRKDSEFDQLTQQKTNLDSENASLKSQLKDCRRDLAEAFKKNRSMWEEVQNIPKKVTELVRQNKLLIAETAGMHYNLGVFYTKNKQFDRAAVEFEKVVEIDPNHAYAHFNLGYIYAEYLVNRQKAARHFRYYLELAKSDDKDVDWVKKYLLTWEAYGGKEGVR